MSKETETLEKEVLALQELLAFTLATVGEPVVITKDVLVAGLPKGAQIVVNDDNESQAFILYLEIPDGE